MHHQVSPARVCRVDDRGAFVKALCEALDQLPQCAYESLKTLDELVQLLPSTASYAAQQILDKMWELVSGIAKQGVQPQTLDDLTLSFLCIVLPELQDGD